MLDERLLHAAPGKGVYTGPDGHGGLGHSYGIRLDSTLLCWSLNIEGWPDANKQLDDPIAGGCLLVEYVALAGRTVAQVREMLAADPSVHAVGEPVRGVIGAGGCCHAASGRRLVVRQFLQAVWIVG